MNTFSQGAAMRTLTLCTAGLVLSLMISGCSRSTRSGDSDPVTSTTARSPESGTSSREMRNAAIEMLLAMSTHERPEIRANALEALRDQDTEIESVVALGLLDENEGVRSVAAMIVGQEKLRALEPTLRSMADSQSSYVKLSVLFALHALDRSTDISPISEALLSENDVRVSSHAAFVIGELGNPSAIPMLKQASQMRYNRVTPIERRLFRLQVAEALVKLGDEQGIDAIRAALYPARPEELEATALAVQIIGEVGDRASADQLIYMADEETGLPMPAEVRLAIAGALAKIGYRSGGFIADQYAQNDLDVIRAQSASVYGDTLLGEHLPKLGDLMGDESPIVRVAAAGAVLKITQR